MKLDKNKTKLSDMRTAMDADFVDASIKERLEMVWDITVQLWSVANKGESGAKPRLQRHVTNLKKI